MTEIKLGKLMAVSFGVGGYQDGMIGITFDIGGDGWGVGDFWGYWRMKRTENTQWTEAARQTHLGETVMRISQLLSDAKRESVEKLSGTPVEVTLDGNTLKSWRVLKEVV